MNAGTRRERIAGALWGVSVIVVGGVLMSFHQPFRTPEQRVLALSPSDGRVGWRAVHFLSGGCGCSQKVMEHMLQRGAMAGISEQIVLVDGPEAYLPGSAELVARLGASGFAVTHVAAEKAAEQAGLQGVPLLVLATPSGGVAYRGGYGSRGDQDEVILKQIRAGETPKALALVGCAVGSRMRGRVDPFHLKY